MDNYNILPIDFGTPAFDEALALRDQLLRKPLNLNFQTKDIAKEYLQFHFGLYSSTHELLACLSFLSLSQNKLKMRQVAVKTSYQSMGLGKRLVVAAEQWAKIKKYDSIICHARAEAVPFYLKMKYNTISDEFQEVGIPHYKMEKKF